MTGEILCSFVVRMDKYCEDLKFQFESPFLSAQQVEDNTKKKWSQSDVALVIVYEIVNPTNLMQTLWAILWAYSSVYLSIMLNFHLDTCFTHGKYRKNTEKL